MSHVTLKNFYDAFFFGGGNLAVSTSDKGHVDCFVPLSTRFDQSDDVKHIRRGRDLDLVGKPPHKAN